MLSTSFQGSLARIIHEPHDIWWSLVTGYFTDQVALGKLAELLQHRGGGAERILEDPAHVLDDVRPGQLEDGHGLRGDDLEGTLLAVEARFG
jgi:hypothetical protein